MTSTVAPKVPDGAGSGDPRDPRGLRTGAPLLDAWLRASAAVDDDVARMSIPGHKWRTGLTGAVVAGDIPLYAGLDTVKQANGLLAEAERRAAALWGADWCRFSVAGSTHGNQALALAVGQPGDEVIVSRTLHRSLLLGLVLAGLRPVWVRPDVDPASGLPRAVPVAAVAAALAAHPKARAVFLGDPSYVGTTGDLAGHAAAAHQAGVPLIVDAAWAAHLGFHPGFPPHALAAGADAMVTSAHKALPAWTQGALVLARTDRLDPARLERAFDATHTTSPAGTILASIDAARELLARDGEALSGRLLAAVAAARARLAEVPGVAVLDGPEVEPGKLVVLLAGAGAHGHAVEADLIAAGMPVEMADRDTIVPIVTLADEPEHVAQFTETLAASIGRHRSAPRPPAPGLAWGLEPQVMLPPRDAFFAAHETVPAEAAPGRVSAELVAPYPPGVPVLAPGELVTAEIVAALKAVLADGGRVAYAADPTLNTLQVVSAPRLTDARCPETEAALLDDQAAVLHVQQPGIHGDVPGLGRGDAQLQPQRGGAGRDRLPGHVRRPVRRPEHVYQADLLRHVGQRPVHALAQDLVPVRVDRDDPPAVLLHVGGHVMGGLGRCPARTDHGDRVVGGQDVQGHGVRIGHLATVGRACRVTVKWWRRSSPRPTARPSGRPPRLPS
jgi:lysine decarboxylase